MKTFSRLCLLVAMTLVFTFARRGLAQPVGRAAADFPNLKSTRQETAWGRLVADALQNAARADLALINAGALRSGTLSAGSVESSSLAALLSFGEDSVVALSLSGAQIRAALERAASVYPTGSPAFLHGAGFEAFFDAEAPSGKRVSSIRVGGRPLDDSATYLVAMPVALAEGAAGYFNIWNGAKAQKSNRSLLGALGDMIRAKGEISPDNAARFGPK